MKKKSALLKSWLNVVLGSAMAIGASSAYAAIAEVESNDTFGTANAANGVVTLTGSIGDINSASNDVDIFSVNLGVGGSAYTASMTYTGLYNEFDVRPVLNLFMEDNSQYFPVASSLYGAELSFTPWAAGTYFLVVTADHNYAKDAFGNNQSTSNFFTTENVRGTAFASFANASFTSFDYSITSSAVPVPAAAWLFGTGLLGLIGVARRKS